MTTISGIGKLDRERLTAVLRSSKDTITVIESAKILNVSRLNAAKLLARWAKKGWVSRIKRSVYIPIPLDSTTADITLEDPWLIAEKLYHPCYISTWTAAEYWGLTEQMFRTIVIFTTQKPRQREPIIKGTHFLLHTISQQTMFGLKTIWRGQTKVFISDPTRTMIDMLAEPKLSGGIRNTIDMLMNYLKSEHKNIINFKNYARHLNNGAVFKRLGFILEQYKPEESELIEFCKNQLTKGRTKLDPQLNANKLITRWRIWIPKEWMK